VENHWLQLKEVLTSSCETVLGKKEYQQKEWIIGSYSQNATLEENQKGNPLQQQNESIQSYSPRNVRKSKQKSKE
jgi:hypothetical protein